MIRQLLTLLFAFVAGTAAAALLGAGFGTALGVGQICFVVALVWALMA